MEFLQQLCQPTGRDVFRPDSFADEVVKKAGSGSLEKLIYAAGKIHGGHSSKRRSRVTAMAALATAFLETVRSAGQQVFTRGP